MGVGQSCMNIEPCEPPTQTRSEQSNTLSKEVANEAIDQWGKQKFSIQYETNHNITYKTVFNISSCNLPHPITHYLNNPCDYNHARYHWALFKPNRKIYREVRGYFTILNDKSTKERINITHLSAFLRFVHDPNIRHYLSISGTKQWDQDININVDEEQYTLKFFNGKNIKQCQAFHILKHIHKDDEKEATKSHKIYALYFPKPRTAIQWKWFNNKESKFMPYTYDDIQMLLEFEASFYANHPDNFPISNPLFRSQHNTSMFDHCYLSRFSELRSTLTQTVQYCMRFTLNVINDNGEYHIIMDQLQMRSRFERSVIRYFDHQKYLENIYNDAIQRVATRTINELPPVVTEHGVQHIDDNILKWVACFSTKNNKYVVKIKRNTEEHKTTHYSIKEKITSQDKITMVCIKKGELITNRCRSLYKNVDYIWARFKIKKDRYCKLANGYWDISFHQDDEYLQLRQHLEVILTVLQNIDVQDRFGIKCNTCDASVFTDNNDQKFDKKDILQVSIEHKQYELLWYNTLPIKAKNTYAHAVCLTCDGSSSKMYIMYFPKPAETTKWKWYNNNNCKYIDYKEQNELLQLECSYLSNLEENYPHHIIEHKNISSIRYFSHCMFTVLRSNLDTRTHYALRYELIEEEENKLITEQLAFISKDEQPFAREVKRITDNELAIIHEEPILHRTVSDGTTFRDVIQRLHVIMVNYQQWIGYLPNLRKPGMLKRIADIYECKDQQEAFVKLQNDFNTFTQQKHTKTKEELIKISDAINDKLSEQFKHKRDGCLCVQRAYRDRSESIDVKQRYFGFLDQIVIQQRLDSYHCELVHKYDTKVASQASSASLHQQASSASLHQQNSDIVSQRAERGSSILNYSESTRNKNKFNTYDTYDTGIRFYYWDWYKNRAQSTDEYQDRVTDPGNDKNNGKKYRFCDWFVVPAAANLKEEILSFGDGSLIGKDQYDILHQTVVAYLNTEHAHQLHCDTTDWENKYGLKQGAVIEYKHVLALRYYCCFTDAADKLRTTFIKLDEHETDEALKKRHSKCALWSMYLRESVEGFGTRLKRGRGIPIEYYRGITKKFLFKKTILRFNLPTSTSVTLTVAEKFARGDGSENNEGLILRLKPHWGDYGGYIRGMNCSTFTDYQWEEEYLFIGGLEPLVIHDIMEISDEIKGYKHKINAMNNIYQIFDGMRCKFQMKPALIKHFIHNRLYAKKKQNGDYISRIFDCYCDDLRSVTIKLRLMDKSYKSVAHIFMDTYSNELKLMQLMMLFPRCECVTIYDGFNYQLIPQNADYDQTILDVIEKCVYYVQAKKHPLKKIMLGSQAIIKGKFLKQFKETLNKYQWNCEPKIDEKEWQDFEYIITRN